MLMNSCSCWLSGEMLACLSQTGKQRGTHCRILVTLLSHTHIALTSISSAQRVAAIHVRVGSHRLSVSLELCVCRFRIQHALVTNVAPVTNQQPNPTLLSPHTQGRCSGPGGPAMVGRSPVSQPACAGRMPALFQVCAPP